MDEWHEEEWPDLDDLPEELDDEPSLSQPAWLHEMPFWALSAMFHLLLILVLASVILDDEKPKREVAEVQMRFLPPPPEYDPLPRRDVKRSPKIFLPKIDHPVIQQKVDEITPDIPKGTDLDNYSNFELNADFINTSIGIGGGAAGAYGDRFGKGSLVREGGSDATEEAVRAALEWLRRHQNPDGSWSARDFTRRCAKTCTNKRKSYGDGRGGASYDVGVTGLAMLAFTGYGHTHRFGVHPEYVRCLRRALGFLKRVQVKSKDPRVNGRYGAEHRKWIYDHAIATLAMAELLVISRDVVTLKGSVEEAVDYCLRSRNPNGGWRYGYQPGDDDTSVIGWMLLALKVARSANLNIADERYERAFRDSLRFLKRATDKQGLTGYRSAGGRDNSSRGWPQPHRFSKEPSCMTAVAVLSRFFAGDSRRDPGIRQGIRHLMRETPRWTEHKGRLLSKINFYYWYYGSYALFQYGGEQWIIWNGRMQRALLTSQRQGNICEDGSWDAIGEWANHGGRVYSTALGAMTLEIYYRYRRAQEGVGF